MVLEILTSVIRPKNKTRYNYRKGRGRFTIFVDNIMYLKKPRKSTEILL